MSEQRPEPLVPTNVDIRDFTFMPLDVSRLRDSDLAANETPEACWAAVLLWAASWHQVPAASIPNDDRWIAKQAGYAQRGKIAREWTDIRGGALRNWVECSDGRLYHPVVAEKAMEAWKAKLRQRWNAECARIKKHNQRHGTSLKFPSYEEWTEGGCPQGQIASSLGDKGDGPPDKGGDKASKGQGEGQGQGQKKTSSSGPAGTGTATISANDLHRKLLAAADGHVANSTGIEVVAPILALMAEGCDLERHILPAIRAVVPKLKKPLGSWGVPFLREEILALKALDGARATASDDPPVRFPGGIVWPKSSVVAAITRWQSDPKTWPITALGYPPGDPSCNVPEDLLVGIAA